jgi:translocation and assembly module TamA
VGLRRVAFLTVVPLAAGCAHESANGRKWVHKLALPGAKHVPKGELKSGLATEQRGWWPFARKKWFDQAALDLDVERVKTFYADRGYFDARVRPEVRDRGDGSVDVFLHVEEGAPTKVDQVAITGLESIDPKRARKLLRRLPLEQGRVYDYPDFQRAKQELALRLKGAGFAYAKVSGDAYVDRDRHTAKLELKTEPGPLVRMGKIHVVGAGAIPTHAVLNRVTWEQGEEYRPNQVGTTQGRLYDLGVFSSVRIELDPHPQEEPEVTIRLHEGKLHDLRLGGGVGVESQRTEVRVRGEWTLYNFLGGLRTLRLRIRPAYVSIPNAWNSRQSGVAAQNDLSLKQPDIFGSNVTMHALVGYDLGIEEGYQYEGPRAQLGFERPFFREHVLGGAAWNLQFLDFFNIDTAVFNPVTTQLGLGFKDPYRLAYLEQYVSLDLRDQPLEPRSGAYAVVRLEEGTSAVAGDFTYFKVTPEARGFAPLGRRLTLAVRAMLGWLDPNSADDSPITRRYSLGGPASHRGFSFGRLSPQAIDPKTMDRIPLGGNGEVLFSAETRLRVFKFADNWVSLTPFFDAGDVTPEFRDIDLGALHLATGLQASYLTPIGAARAGVGFRLNRTDLIGPNRLPNPDPGEHVAFFFSIGEAF